MTVVITGSESFIGSELKRLCDARKIDFIGIDSKASDDSRCVQMDIRSPQVTEAIPQGADALVHLAAISRDGDCRQDPYLAFDVNVQGTLNLIRAARERGVRQFVFASSEWVYGQVENNAVQTEDQPIDITRISSAYALTKVVGEQCLRQAFDQGMCNVTVLRFAIVYGPRRDNWSAVESLLNAVLTQDSVSVGSLSTARRFVHVSDIASGIVASLGTAGFETVNLSGDRLVALRDVIEESCEVAGRRPEVRETNASAISIRDPDNRKAHEIFGWSPAIGLNEGLSTLMAYTQPT